MTIKEGLAEFNQFVLWREEPNPDGGKPLKVTFDPATGGRIDAHDPANWMCLKDAEATGKSIGFVLTDSDPYFCIDLDGQLQADGSWSEWSQQMCAAFPGAGVELSHNKNGLHIWGRTNNPGSHRTRVHTVPGLEVYSTKRFIALGSNSTGDPNIDHNGAFNAIINQYFPPPLLSMPSAAWTDAPVAEWGGETDDTELIKRMLNSRASPKAAMFGGATPHDLWTANLDKLGMAYPDPVRDFDHSAADAALFAHLAFWTGKDCVRMERLFRQSAIMSYSKLDRDGYKPHGYLVGTITKANAITKNVYQKRKMPERKILGPEDESKIVVSGSDAVLRDGLQFLHIAGQMEHFKGCTYIQDIHRILVPEGSLLKPDQFKAMFGGYEFAIDNGGKTSKDAWEAFTQSRIAMFPKAHGLCFRPDQPPCAIIDTGRRRTVNTYIPDMGAQIEGDVTPFLRQLGLILPDERDRMIFLCYMAASVQHIGVKFQWWPLLQGVEGNGKTFFMKCVEHAVGTRYTHYPRASQMGGQFNGWIQNKVFIGIEEIHMRDKFELLDAMKPLVTNDRIPIEMKGVDELNGDNRANGIMCTNYQDALIKTANDRRYGIFFTAQQTALDLLQQGMDSDYFSNLYHWARSRGGYEAVAYYLAHYPIPDEFNPATRLNRAPMTTSTPDAIQLSMGRIEQEVLAAAGEGNVPGFMGGWLSSSAMSTLLDAAGVKKPSPNRRRMILNAIGYVAHPALKEGRSPRIIAEEGGRPYLYLRGDSPMLSLEAKEVLPAYRQSQGWV